MELETKFLGTISLIDTAQLFVAFSLFFPSLIFSVRATNPLVNGNTKFITDTKCCIVQAPENGCSIATEQI